MASPALLDACVLVPSMLRNLLLWVATEGVFEPCWSTRILEETRRNVLRLRPEVSPVALDRTIAQMSRAFPDALVEGWEPLEGHMVNHPKDRHVLAAAVAGGAAVVVTSNLRDFPDGALAPHGVAAVHPDSFLRSALESRPAAVAGAISALVSHTGKSGREELTPQQLLDAVASGGTPVPDFADAARPLFA